MNEIFEAIKNRISNPVFGYYVISVSVANWDSLFYAIFSNTDVVDRINYVNLHTDIYSLAVFPLLAAIIIAISHQWILFCIEFLNQNPLFRSMSIREKIVHDTEVLHNNFELERRKLLADAESALIESAKKYNDIADIKDDDIKNALKKDIDDLREKYKTLNNVKYDSQQHSKFRELMDAANEYRSKADMSNSNADRDKYSQMAMRLEEEGYRNLVPDSDSNYVNINKKRRVA